MTNIKILESIVLIIFPLSKWIWSVVPKLWAMVHWRAVETSQRNHGILTKILPPYTMYTELLL